MKATARLVIAVALPFATRSRAEVPEHFHNQAAIRFEAGIAARQNEDAARAHFREAAKEYESGMLYDPAPALYRMTGNAWLLADNLPRAIHAYRQGLIRDPDDPGLRRGLDLARSRVAYVNSENRVALTPRPRALEWPKRQIRGWGIGIVAAVNTLGWVAFARWIVTRRPRWMVIYCIAATLTLAVAAAWVGERVQRRSCDAIPFAVVAQPTILRSGDGPSFMPRRDVPLPAGVEGRVVKNSGSWLQIELADGTVGWFPTSSVLLPD